MGVQSHNQQRQSAPVKNASSGRAQCSGLEDMALDGPGAGSLLSPVKFSHVRQVPPGLLRQRPQGRRRGLQHTLDQPSFLTDNPKARLRWLIIEFGPERQTSYEEGTK
jgi:hypothetical protein